MKTEAFVRQCFEAGKRGDVLALGAGAALPIAFAPFHWFFFMAVYAPAILLATWIYVSPARAFWRGFLFGVGLFGIGVSWVFVSIHEFGNANVFLAALLTALFVMGLALFPAIQGYVFNKCFPNKTTLKMVLVFPLTWVLMEWFRSWILTGFPWLLLGYSQVNAPLNGFIPILGVYGTGFLVVFGSGLWVYAAEDYYSLSKWINTMVIFIVIWGLGWYLGQIQWTRPIGKPQTVALIQGDISQHIKWQPGYLRSIVKTYYDLTAKHWQHDIIVWPEGAIPVPLKNARGFVDSVSAQAKARGVSLFAGIPVAMPGNSFYYYNALIAMGKGSGHYYKRHLVPFGEFVPFAWIAKDVMNFLNIPTSNLVAGPKVQPDLMAGSIQIAPFICYEIAYPNVLRQALPQAQILLTVSDDAWFGDSLAPFQHLQIGQFRARQSGRELLFSGNNGITAIVNARGQVVKRVPQFKRTVLTGVVQPMIGTTPWVRYGNGPIIFLMWLLLLGLWIQQTGLMGKGNETRNA